MPIKILVADDDKLNCYVVEETLKHEGFEPVTVHDGKSALEVLQRDDAPCLAILDWMMPELDGIEVCRRLRQEEAGRQIYLILLTSRDEESCFFEAFEAGADDFVLKPFGPRQFLARINAGMRVVKLQQELAAEKNHLRQAAEDLAKANIKLEKAALTDVLTGLPNRRHLVEFISEEWRALLELDKPVSCLLIDIDHFKQVNDTSGHKVGDLVLKMVGNLLSVFAQEEDFACRYGGEEFVVVCPETSLKEAIEKAESIRMMINNDLADTFTEAGHTITVSIGVATTRQETTDADELIKEADMYMYQAKANGRDQVFSLLSCAEVSPQRTASAG